MTRYVLHSLLTQVQGTEGQALNAAPPDLASRILLDLDPNEGNRLGNLLPEELQSRLQYQAEELCRIQSGSPSSGPVQEVADIAIYGAAMKVATEDALSRLIQAYRALSDKGLSLEEWKGSWLKQASNILADARRHAQTLKRSHLRRIDSNPRTLDAILGLLEESLRFGLRMEDSLEDRRRLKGLLLRAAFSVDPRLARGL